MKLREDRQNESPGRGGVRRRAVWELVMHDHLHSRGGHGVTWQIDGVPVPNSNLATVGSQFDPKDVDYLETKRGGLGANYGDRSYGVFNVVPRSGFEGQKFGEFLATYG